MEHNQKLINDFLHKTVDTKQTHTPSKFASKSAPTTHPKPSTRTPAGKNKTTKAIKHQIATVASRPKKIHRTKIAKTGDKTMPKCGAWSRRQTSQKARTESTNKSQPFPRSRTSSGKVKTPAIVKRPTPLKSTKATGRFKASHDKLNTLGTVTQTRDITTSTTIPAGKQRCSSIALAGLPNSGKSTLLNYLIGSKVSIVSSKPQTTRTTLRGILLEQDTQLIFMDTPGIFADVQPRSLEHTIVKSAWSGISEANMVCLIIDAQKGLQPGLRLIIRQLSSQLSPKTTLIAAINKIDVANEAAKLSLTKSLDDLKVFREIFMLSALRGKGVDQLKRYLLETAPTRPWRYGPDEITDAPWRFRMAEITREKLFVKLHKELPYTISVRNELWQPLSDGSLKIHQVIYVLREGHKKILLSQKGQLLKEVGEAARQEMSEALGHPVHLYLFVKISDWQKDDSNFSYDL